MLNDSAISFSVNMTWLVAALAAAIVMGVGVWRLRKTRPSYWWTMLGIVFVAAPTAVHRLYYSVVNWHFSHNNDVAAIGLLSYKEYFLILLPIVVVGYGFHIKALLESILGKHWWTALLASLAFVFSVSLISVLYL